MVQRLRGILEKQSLGITRTVEGEAISGGGKLQQDLFTSSIWQKQHRRQALTCGAFLFHRVLRSVARLSMSAVLPHDLEAVLCKLYFHYTYVAVHTKISTNTPTNPPTNVIKRTLMLEYKSWSTSVDAYTT